ncbi:hypothetical protein HID58_086886 [Brassica napus]|uniref:Uncharacterized protein n=1 Tax=Brassica napus TaxID=3708 RepID=A0ABQ7XRR1_BRANA|nr:hypothetical protein HID58_086886 [Brassica napus]
MNLNMEDACGIFFVIHISSDHLLSDHCALDPSPPPNSHVHSHRIHTTVVYTDHIHTSSVHKSHIHTSHIPDIDIYRFPVHNIHTNKMLSTVFLFHFMRASSRIVLSSPELATETAAA